MLTIDGKDGTSVDILKIFEASLLVEHKKRMRVAFFWMTLTFSALLFIAYKFHSSAFPILNIVTLTWAVFCMYLGFGAFRHLRAYLKMARRMEEGTFGSTREEAEMLGNHIGQKQYENDIPGSSSYGSRMERVENIRAYLIEQAKGSSSGKSTDIKEPEK